MTLGCSPATSESDLALILGDQKAKTNITIFDNQEYDLGPILAKGQTIRHQFTLLNPTDRAIELMGAEAMTPCCSAVEALPKSIPPGGKANVEVMFKPGLQSGRKGIRFLVQWKLPDQPSTTVLTLLAYLFSEWNIEQLPDSTTTLPVNVQGSQKFRLTTRTSKGEGLEFPQFLTASEPLRVQFVGSAVQSNQVEGFLEFTRDLEIQLPPTPNPGIHTSEIAFGWPNGTKKTHAIQWSTKPRLTASPSAFIIKTPSQSEEKTLTLTSDDRPFRVESLEKSDFLEVAELPKGLERTHRLKVQIKPSRENHQTSRDVIVHTNHPDAPTVHLTILFLPSGREQQ